MHHHYKDILEKIDEEPQWWDEEAVPRFCEFKPWESANIYADSVVLVLISCQNCDQEFKVCFSDTMMSAYHRWRTAKWYETPEKPVLEWGEEAAAKYSLKGRLQEWGELHYGDPPNYCCGVGATMNSIPHKVLEWWERSKDPKSWAVDQGFIRVPDLEIEFENG